MIVSNGAGASCGIVSHSVLFFISFIKWHSQIRDKYKSHLFFSIKKHIFSGITIQKETYNEIWSC